MVVNMKLCKECGINEATKPKSPLRITKTLCQDCLDHQPSKLFPTIFIEENERDYETIANKQQPDDYGYGDLAKEIGRCDLSIPYSSDLLEIGRRKENEIRIAYVQYMKETLGEMEDIKTWIMLNKKN